MKSLTLAFQQAQRISRQNQKLTRPLKASLGDTNVELHATKAALGLLMLEGRKRAGEVVARVKSLHGAMSATGAQAASSPGGRW